MSTSGWGDFERALATLASAHDVVAPLLEHGPPSESAVASLVAQQLAAAMAGTASTAGTDAMRLRGIAYEVLAGPGPQPPLAR